MAATTIAKVSGDSQRARVKQTLSNALTVLVTDNLSAPVQNQTVTFQVSSVPQGATGQSLTGNVQSVDVLTDINGQAQTFLTLGNVAGVYQVKALSVGLTGSPITFSLTATPANAIISLSDVKSYLKISDANTEKDDLLQSFINTSSKEIEEFIRAPVVVQEYTEIYNGSGHRKLFTYHWPIVDLLTNTVDPVTGFVTDIQYRITPIGDWINFITRREYVMINPNEPWYIFLWSWAFPGGYQNIRCAYKAGYVDIPGEISQVCLERTAEVFEESKQGMGRMSLDTVGVNTGGVSTTTKYKDMSKEHIRILSMFRHQFVYAG